MIMKKILSFVLVALLSLSSAAVFVGCGGKTQGEKVDPNKTQLYVGVYDGALGTEWLYEYKKEYEALHPDVQIWPDEKKNEYSDGQLISTIKNSRQDVYFLSANNYSAFVDKGLLLDITDCVTEKVYDEKMNLVGESGTKSIEDLMYADFKDIYRVNEKYYGLPNWISPSGIIYDNDLFEENGYTVPETYEAFKDLWDVMVSDHIIPFSFSSFDYILLSALSNVWASYEGKANYELNNTYSGYDTGLKMDITPQKAYLLQGQEGKRAALTFARDLASNNAYTTQGTKNGQLNADAQNDFVGSVMNPSQNRVAMFLESSYWECEAKDTINAVGNLAKDPEMMYGKRDFRYMPFPKFEGTDGVKDSTNTKTTVFCSNTSSMVCVNAATTKADLAKDFVQFVHDRQNLAIYTQYTSCIRPFNYEMTEDELAKCTPFGRSIYETVHDPDVELTYDRTINKTTQAGGEEFMWDWKFKTDSPTVTRSPFLAFYQNKTATVDSYVEGMKRIWSESNWLNNYLK